MPLFFKTNNSDSRRKLVVSWPLVAAVPLVIILFLGLAISARKDSLTSTRSRAMVEREDLVNVITCRIQPTPIRDRINLPALVAPWSDLDVLAQVSDIILEQKVSEGETVKKGQTLAVVDSRKYENAFESARASLRSSKATLSRISRLRQRNLASQSDLDSITATVEKERAALETAALDLERCQIKAPVDGTVNRIYVDPGQVVEAGQRVAQILQLDPVKVTAGIPESDVSAVRRLNTFTVIVDALDGRTFTGTRHFLSSTAAETARLYDLEIRVDNPDGEILPDMFARVDIVKQTVPEALVVPLYAVTATSDDKYIVYVEKNGVIPLGGDAGGKPLGLLTPPDQTGLVQSREVTLGIREGLNVQITSGLSPGEHVVIVGQKRIGHGQKVNVVRTVDDPAQAGQ
ncbi:MAG: efflux RND transporter periplasmic adaptor subunit [Desulfosudaceae bacterium]